MSYFIGHRLGGQFLSQMLPGVEPADLDLTHIGKGVLDGLTGELDMSIVNEDAEQIQQDFLAMLQARGEKIANKNAELGKIYLQANGARPEVRTAPSGLQYEVINEGGADKYDPDMHGEAPMARVMYKGMLVDGTVFDESDEPVEFNVRQVIPGFTEALLNMPIGAKWRVTIPSDLAYGAQGPGPIGPNSTLVFELELLALTAAADAGDDEDFGI